MRDDTWDAWVKGKNLYNIKIPISGTIKGFVELDVHADTSMEAKIKLFRDIAKDESSLREFITIIGMELSKAQFDLSDLNIVKDTRKDWLPEDWTAERLSDGQC